MHSHSTGAHALLSALERAARLLEGTADLGDRGDARNFAVGLAVACAPAVLVLIGVVWWVMG